MTCTKTTFFSLAAALLTVSYVLSAGFAFAQNEEEQVTEEAPFIDAELTRPSAEELNRTSELAERFLSGTITPEEAAELEESGTTIEMLNAQPLPNPGQPSPAVSEASQPLAAEVAPAQSNSMWLAIYGLVAVNILLLILLSMSILKRKEAYEA